MILNSWWDVSMKIFLMVLMVQYYGKRIIDDLFHGYERGYKVVLHCSIIL